MKSKLMRSLAIAILTFATSNLIYGQTVGDTFVSADNQLMYTVTATGIIKTVSVKKGNESSGDLSIPDSVTYNSANYKVTSIEASGFSLCNGLTSISIPKSVLSIGNRAFEYCTWVTTVTIGDGVTSIGEAAFQGCTKLNTLIIGKNVQSIGQFVFYECNNLTTVNYNAESCNDLVPMVDQYAYAFPSNTTAGSFAVIIGHNVKRIPGYLFSRSNKIKSVSFEEKSSCKSIGDYAFLNCNNSLFTNIIIPDSVINIGAYAFKACTSISSLTIGSGVKKIGQYAFNGCTGLTHLDFPNTLETISEFAFSGCTGLTTLSTGNGVASIEKAAFQNCTGLTSLTIGNNIQSIGRSAFYGCNYLTSITFNATNCSNLASNSNSFPTDISTEMFIVTIGQNVKRIPAYLFYGYTKLKTVVFEGVSTCKSIGDYAFSNCNNTLFNSFTVPESVDSIGQYAFSGCENINKLTIGTGVKTIGQYAFTNCNGLTQFNYNATNCADLTNPGVYTTGNKYSLIIGSNVTRIPAFLFCESGSMGSLTFDGTSSCTEIGNMAFMSCNQLSSLTLPATIKSIGDMAFFSCAKISSVIIPASVISIGDGAFANSPVVLSVDAGNPAYIIQDSILYDKAQTKLLQYKFTKIGAVAIPATVISIQPYAFYNCAGLTSIAFPESVNIIGSMAFNGCSRLISITIPQSVNEIGSYAFEASGLLTICMQGSTPPAVGKGAFFFGYDKSTLYVPFGTRNVYLTDYGLFFDDGNNIVEGTTFCTVGGIQYAITDVINKKMTVIENSTLYTGIINIPAQVNYNSESYTVSSIECAAFSKCPNLISVNMPASIKAIRGYTFEGSTNLTSLSIPDSVSSIGKCAFQGCTGLTSIVLPDSVKLIKESAFADCTNLTTVTLGNSLSSIAPSAFKNCTQLLSVTIPESVTMVGNNAFSSCSRLTTINFNAINCSKMGDGSISPFTVFSDCPKLTNLNIGSSVTNIPDYAFYSGTGLTSVIIGNAVLNIGKYAFYGCSGITDIVIGSGVKTIDNMAFANCTKLTTLMYNATNCTSAGNSSSYVFKGCSSLTSATVGNNVTNLPNYLFYDCSKLTTINMKTSTPPILGGGYLFWKIGAGAILYVPQGSKADYISYNTNTTYTRFFSSTGSSDGARIIESATAVKEINAINVFINCNNNGQIVISSNNALSGKVSVYNIAGQLQINDRLDGVLTVLPRHLSSGVYIVIVEENGNMRSEKVVIN